MQLAGWFVFVCLQWLGSGASGVGILLICDQTFHGICRQKLNDAKGDVRVVSVSTDDSFVTYVTQIDSLLRNDTGHDVVVVLGDSALVSAVGTVAQETWMPVIAYSRGASPLIYQSVLLSVNSNAFHRGQAMLHLIDNLWLDKHTHLFVDASFLYDGFLEGFHNEQLFNFTYTTVLHENDEDLDEIALFLLLQDLRESGVKQFVVHARPELVNRLMRANSRKDIGRRYQWLLSEDSVSNITEENFIPEGSLVLRSIQDDQTVVEHLLRRVFMEVENIKYNRFSGDDYDCIRDVLVRKSSRNTPLSCGIGQFEINNHFWRVINESLMELEWMSAGKIFYNRSKYTIQWHGSTILGPIFRSKNFHRVVTTPAPPFVMVKGPMDPGESCYGNKMCYKVLRGNPIYLGPNTVVEDLKNVEVERYCCSGFVMDILEYLSTDLAFDYLVYFRDNAGHNDTGRYEAMIHDVGNGSADIIAGALTITSSRSKTLRFTEPYYFTGFAMAVPLEATKPSIDAFTAPFDGHVWLAIFLSATTAAFATSLFEWNSPFGLNPWGRKRLKNYTLGSALVMVYSVLFGHTVSTKSPKSWPAKLLQNFWAGLAIFIVASYTANLAAYLAGINRVDEIISIFHKNMNAKHVYVKKSSPAANYLRVINERLHKDITITEIPRDESSLNVVNRLRNKTYEVFINDRLLLEYALAQHDNCSIKFSGHDFGENLYAFGLSREAAHLTVLEEEMSSLILSYLEGGRVTEAMQRYIKIRNCRAQTERFTRKYGLDHTGGLFIILLSAMFVGALLLVIELCVFRYLVPYLRKKPKDSLWKNRNIEYINQRLYRTVMSEQLVSPQQTAQEMIRIVKERQFERLFLKNELRDHGRVQRKGFPKGLRLIDITDNLIRSKKAESQVFATSSSGNLYSIKEKGGEDDDSLSEVSDDVSDYVTGDEQDLQISVEDIKDMVTNVSEVPINNQRLTQQPCPETTRTRSLKVMPGQYVRSKPRVRFSSDSTVGRSSLSSSHKRNKSCPNFQKGPTKERTQSPCEIDEIEMQERTERPDRTKLIHKSKRGNIGRAFTFYGKSLKDNRLKSSIRSHAMATRRHSDSVFDDCAVDVLSKEDLMVLWKKSEIELQTSLNRVTQENAHLKRLLRVVEVSERVSEEEVPEKEPTHITATQL